MNKSIFKLLCILFVFTIEIFSQNRDFDQTREDIERELEGILTLRFFDAVTGKPIIKANVEIGDIVNEVTDFEGKIKFEIPEDGNYLINFSHPKYAPSILKLEVVVGTIFNNRFSVSPMLPIGSLRVVLDWGNKPNDLDAHLTKSNDYHISFRNMKVNNDNTAKLDRDDLDGFGPETITVSNINTNSEYFYYVHNYSNKDAGESKDLSNSKARILVFGDNRLIEQIEISKNISGKFWNVFKIINGKIVVLNNLTNSTIN